MNIQAMDLPLEPGAWTEVLGNRELESGVEAVFGDHEESIHMLVFTDGTIEVGYQRNTSAWQQFYLGESEELASREWFAAVAEQLGYSPDK